MVYCHYYKSNYCLWVEIVPTAKIKKFLCGNLIVLILKEHFHSHFHHNINSLISKRVFPFGWFINFKAINSIELSHFHSCGFIIFCFFLRGHYSLYPFIIIFIFFAIVINYKINFHFTIPFLYLYYTMWG